MRIGLTYDLRDDYLAAGYSEEETAEFDTVETIDAIDAALTRLGHTTDRIGRLPELARRLVDGERWELVFNIAEGMQGIGREAQVPALLEAYGIACVFSDPLVCALTLHKGITKRVIRDAGLPTAPFAVVAEIKDIDAISLPYPLFAKPLGEGSGKGISPLSIVRAPDQLRTVCSELLELYDAGVLVESYLPGRELTVGIVGTGSDARVVGVLEVELVGDAEADVYSYVNKERYDEYCYYHLVDDELAQRSAELALAAWRLLGCRDGGRVDVRADSDGNPCFLETNPLAGLNPKKSDLPIMWSQSGRPYDELIGAILASALRRQVPVSRCIESREVA